MQVSVTIQSKALHEREILRHELNYLMATNQSEFYAFAGNSSQPSNWVHHRTTEKFIVIIPSSNFCKIIFSLQELSPAYEKMNELFSSPSTMASKVDARPLMSVNFPPEFNQKVDMQKVNLHLIKRWIANEIFDILGNEDDVIIKLCFNLIEGMRYPDIKYIQFQLNIVLDKDRAPPFCKDLWKLLLSAQGSPQGMPKELLEAKKLELMQEKRDADKVAYDARRSSDDFDQSDCEVSELKVRDPRDRSNNRGDTWQKEFTSFACQYWKKDPLKHGDCLSQHIPEVQSLRQHLHIYHTPGLYCERCFTIFQTHRELKSHIENIICQSPSNEVGFITYEIRRQLDWRQFSALGDEDAWFEIWDLLFPDVERPGTPYLNTEPSLNLAVGEFTSSHGVENMLKTCSIDKNDREHDARLLGTYLRRGIEQIPIERTKSKKQNTPSPSSEKPSDHHSVPTISPGFESFHLSLAHPPAGPTTNPKSISGINTTVVDSGISTQSGILSERNWLSTPDTSSDGRSMPADMSVDLELVPVRQQKVGYLERMKLGLQQKIDEFPSQREDLQDEFAKPALIPWIHGGSDEILPGHRQFDRASAVMSTRDYWDFHAKGRLPSPDPSDSFVDGRERAVAKPTWDGTRPKQERVPIRAWGQFEGTLRSLYLEDRKPLKEVMSIMAEKYNFRAPLRMYTIRFSQWGFGKNVIKEGVGGLRYIKFQRNAEGKNGNFISPNRSSSSEVEVKNSVLVEVPWEDSDFNTQPLHRKAPRLRSPGLSTPSDFLTSRPARSHVATDANDNDSKCFDTSPLPSVLDATNETASIVTESDSSSQTSDDMVLPEEVEIFQFALQTVFGLTVEDASIPVDKWKPLVLDFVKGLYGQVRQSTNRTEESGNSQSIPPGETLLCEEGPSRALGKRAAEIDGNIIDEDTSGGNGRVRTAKKPRIADTLGLRFSCPYRKRNPERFNVRKRYSCSMTFFGTMAKVREHITSQHRKETRPGIMCQCCKAVFATPDDLDIHNRATPPERCNFKSLDPLDGISNDTFNKLTCRKGSYGRDNSNEWSELWKLVFPGDRNCDVRPPCELDNRPMFQRGQGNLTRNKDYHAVMEHFELRDQYLDSLPQLIQSLNVPDKQLETKIRSHFLKSCEEVERIAEDMDYVNDQSRLKEKSLLGKIQRQMRRQAALGSATSPDSAIDLLPPGLSACQSKAGPITTPSDSSQSNETNTTLQSRNSRLLQNLQPSPVPVRKNTSMTYPGLLSTSQYVDVPSSHNATEHGKSQLLASTSPWQPTAPQRCSGILPGVEMNIEVSKATNDDPTQEPGPVGMDNAINENWLDQLDDIFHIPDEHHYNRQDF